MNYMNEKDEIKKIVAPVKDPKIKAKLERDIGDLLVKMRYPNNFCDACGAQMFFNGQVFVCKNCGPKAPATPPTPPPIQQMPSQVNPSIPVQPTNPRQDELTRALGIRPKMAKH